MAEEEESEPNRALWISRSEAIAGVPLGQGGVKLLRLFDMTGNIRVDAPEINVVHGQVSDAGGKRVPGLAIAVTLADGRKQVVSTDQAGRFAVNTGALKDDVDVELA